VRDYGVESSMRLDVFQAKLAAEKNIKSSGLWEKLSSEERRLVDKMVALDSFLDFRESCLDRS
jgi:metallopeptidase MepB